MQLIDKIIPEPPGGAHKDADGMAAVIKENLLQVPFRTMREQMADVLNRRYAKYRKIGAYLE